MSTPAQIAANQANSKLSTGATTDAGKKIVSQNVVKHQLCAKGHPALPGERNAAPRTRRRLHSGLRPVGVPERIWSATSPRITCGCNAPTRMEARPRYSNHVGPIGQPRPRLRPRRKPGGPPSKS